MRSTILIVADQRRPAGVGDQGRRIARDGEAWSGRFEGYLTDPESEPVPANWRTEIAYLIED